MQSSRPDSRSTEFRQGVAAEFGKLSQHVTFQRMQLTNNDE